jgi:hypothetical protein
VFTNKTIRSSDFWIALVIVIVAILLIVATWLGWFRLSTVLAGEAIHHWFSWIGAGFIGIFLPIYSILKRRYPHRLKTLISIHVFGNLLAVTAISIHLSHHLTRPSQSYPDLGTGIALIAALAVLVITGFVIRFQLMRKGLKSWRWVHAAIILGFYLIIVIHILHGTGIINQ